MRAACYLSGDAGLSYRLTQRISSIIGGIIQILDKLENRSETEMYVHQHRTQTGLDSGPALTRQEGRPRLLDPHYAVSLRRLLQVQAAVCDALATACWT